MPVSHQAGGPASGNYCAARAAARLRYPFPVADVLTRLCADAPARGRRTAGGPVAFSAASFAVRPTRPDAPPFPGRGSSGETRSAPGGTIPSAGRCAGRCGTAPPSSDAAVHVVVNGRQADADIVRERLGFVPHHLAKPCRHDVRVEMRHPTLLVHSLSAILSRCPAAGMVAGETQKKRPPALRRRPFLSEEA